MATTTLDMDVPDVVDIRSGERFAISSGTITLASGGQSIGRVGINSGRISVTSGEVHIQSGLITLGSGANRIGSVAVNSGKINVASGLIGVTSGKVSILSGEVHIMSGQVIGKVSGETITTASGSNVTTRKGGESDNPFSGYACTNTYVYSGVGFLKYDKATILLECLAEGSGVSWTVRGHPVSGLLTYSIGSGQLTSGEQTLETLTDPYEYIEVGAENTVDNHTGILTVTVARR